MCKLGKGHVPRDQSLVQTLLIINLVIERGASSIPAFVVHQNIAMIQNSPVLEIRSNLLALHIDEYIKNSLPPRSVRKYQLTEADRSTRCA